ncbi:S41 family peptidase [soil metagenome]
MSFKTRVSVLLLSTPVLAFVLVGGLLGNNAAARTSGDDKFQQLRVFEDVVQLVMAAYVEDVKVDKVMGGAMRGLADGLDPDSAYLTPEQVREVQAGTLPTGDVGLALTRQFYLRVIAARDGSPAARAGLLTGDYIRAIDGKATRDLTVFEGTRLLRGEPGSKVVLTVIRGNAAEPHEITLVREKAQPPPLTSKMLEAGVGYIRIPAFTASTPADVTRHADQLARAGARALIVDVRRTAEGRIDDGIATARLFVKSGTLTARAGRAAEGQADTPKEPVVANPGDGAIALPVQLLISAGTSGAAEVFAAALDGNNRADLIGEHTIGRAAAQKLVLIRENHGLWLTHARYLTPAGELIHGKGLKPDVAIDEPDVDFGVALPKSDPVLEAALEHAKKALLLVPGL